eukprot:11170265-Lingulodinium_polyedra.AAC.1
MPTITDNATRAASNSRMPGRTWHRSMPRNRMSEASVRGPARTKQSLKPFTKVHNSDRAITMLPSSTEAYLARLSVTLR